MRGRKPPTKKQKLILIRVVGKVNGVKKKANARSVKKKDTRIYKV